MKKLKFIVSLFVAFLLVLCCAGAVMAEEKTFVYEFESLPYTGDEGVWTEIPYSHEALPVDSVANFNFMEVNKSLNFEFNLEKAGSYFVTVGYVMNNNSSLMEIKIDDTVMPVQIELNNNSSWFAASSMVGYITLDAGAHTFSAKGVSEGRTEGKLDYFKLTEFDGSFIYEFEGKSWNKSADNIHLEPNYTHSALPVDAVVFTNLMAEGNYIETNSLFIPKDGKYSVDLSYLLDQAHGTVQILIDDIALGDPVNGNHEGGWAAAEIALGDIELKQGVHKITVKSVSGAFETRLDSLSFKLAEDNGGENNGDNETNPGTGNGSLLAVCFAIAIAASVVYNHRKCRDI